jgi:phosphoribosyl 1,2-cyclic phosphodiesterase
MSDSSPTLGVTILGSGSRGNALVLQTATSAVLLDAGFSARELAQRLAQAGLEPSLLSAIVITHEHADHVRGLRVFAERHGLPVFANRGTATVLKSRDRQLGSLHLFAAGSPFQIGPFTLHPFSIPHDANDPVAFVVQTQERRIGIATDLGHVNHLVTHQLRECDLLVLESNHDLTMLGNSQRPWALKQRILSRHGHLSNAACMDLLRTVVHARTRHVVLAHASSECNCRELVAKAVADCLISLGRTDISAHIAPQDEPLPTLWV